MTDEQYNELHRIANRHRGVLRAEDVVEHARSPKSALHDVFTWDDSEAAHQYRLWQAREFIRVAVRVVDENPNTEPVQAFVSLMSDRTRKGGGYRLITTVLSNEELRAQMLADALSEMVRFQVKYKQLHELAKVFAAMDEITTPKAAGV